jgi:hypothetical protein
VEAVSDAEMVALPKVDLQILFDLAVTSLNCMSGFWDHEDEEAAERIAAVLGVPYGNYKPYGACPSCGSALLTEGQACSVTRACAGPVTGGTRNP